MARPTSGYYKQDGTRVFSVTEVLSKFKNADPLVAWAWKLGAAAGYNKAKGLPAPRHAFDERDQSAKSGSIAHDKIEAHILGKEYEYDGARPQPGVMEKAEAAFHSAKLWLGSSSLSIVSTEESLVSEKFGFGGTYDALGKDSSGEYRLLDWKTANHIHVDYLMQVAAYGILLDECKGIKVAGYDILRFSKEHADFEHKHFQDLTDAKNAFILMLRCLPFVLRLEDRV